MKTHVQREAPNHFIPRGAPLMKTRQRSPSNDALESTYVRFDDGENPRRIAKIRTSKRLARVSFCITRRRDRPGN